MYLYFECIQKCNAIQTYRVISITVKRSFSETHGSLAYAYSRWVSKKEMTCTGERKNHENCRNIIIIETTGNTR